MDKENLSGEKALIEERRKKPTDDLYYLLNVHK